MIDLVIQAAKAEGRDDKGYDSINPIWSVCKAIDHKMSIHFSGEYPKFLFEPAAPNETKEVRKYKEQVYKAITTPPTGRALAATRRVWNPANFNLPDLGDYLTKEYPGYGSLMNYFIQMFHPKKLEWANAVQVVRPRIIPTKVIDGKEVVDASKPAEPIAVIIPCKNVVDFNDNYVLVKLESKAPVKYGNEVRHTGRIFEHYTAENIIRYTEVSEEHQAEPKFVVEVLFTGEGHRLGYIPAIKLKGAPKKSMEGRMIYESYFAPALPMLESALLDHSLLQLGKTHAYPHPWSLVDKCGNPRCAGGQVMTGRNNENDQPIWEDCPTCGGSGSRNPGPLGEKQIQVRNNDGDISAGIPTPPDGFTSPQVDIYDFMRKEIDTQIEQAFMMLQIDVSNSQVKGSETALGKQIDRDELFSFLQTLANELFDAFQWTVNTVGKMREGSWKEIEIKPPHDFQIRSQQDLTEEIANTSIPAIVRKDTIDEFISMRFAHDPVSLRINEIIQYADGLYMLSPEDIRIHSMELQPEDKILHMYILKYIREFMEANPNWINGKLAEIAKQLEERALADVKTAELSPLFDAGVEMDAEQTGDALGKIPLAVQQLALGRERAITAGDTALAKQLGDKMEELLAKI